ncbi:MAG: hypothetical protein ABI665_21540, partial [Vicinamibacterales bacterium]
MLDTGDAPTSVLAFLTTVHLALVVLRAHRSSSTSLSHFVSAISVLFSASPWMMPSPVGLAAGFGAHVAWFAACERLLTPPPSAAAPARPAAPAPPAPGVVQMARQSKEVKPAVPAARRPKDF